MVDLERKRYTMEYYERICIRSLKRLFPVLTIEQEEKHANASGQIFVINVDILARPLEYGLVAETESKPEIVFWILIIPHHMKQE
jgi:hypothetical protein